MDKVYIVWHTNMELGKTVGAVGHYIEREPPQG